MKGLFILIFKILCSNLVTSQVVYYNYDFNKNLISSNTTISAENIVQNLQNGGIGSLRQVITDACPEDTVSFNPTLLGDTITLTGPEISINRSVYILGLDMNNLTTSGENNSRIFNIEPYTVVGIEGLKLINGSSSSDGGAILNQSELLLKNVIFEHNLEGGSPKAFSNKGEIKIEGLMIIKQ